jgi:aryl-alcohol dehydrogenase-like predicted oxidoreductase
MEYTVLGRTNLKVSRSGFGALPIQRVSFDEAERLLLSAFDAGINFFDTARAYTDSEEKMGRVVPKIRSQIIIATKTMGASPEKLTEDLETSLRSLKTDYVDIYQLHNPPEVPKEGSPIYEALRAAKKAGKIRFISITAHKLTNAVEAAESGLYDTVQYPLSALSDERELDLARKFPDLGIIAMKAMCGGLLKSAAPSMAYLRRFPNVVPIWGFQAASELNEVIALEKNPPPLDEAMSAEIAAIRAELSGDFCRGCGYCKPCPREIIIDWCARMPLLLRRAPWRNFTNEHWRGEMAKIESCTGCGACKARCPYELDTPKLLADALADFKEFLRSKGLS